MGKILGKLAAIITASLGNLFGSWKGWLALTFLGFVTLNLYNLYVDIIEEILQFVLTSLQAVQQPGGMPSTAVQMTGLAAWFAQKLKLAECFSFIVNITMLKWMLAKLPFIQW